MARTPPAPTPKCVVHSSIDPDQAVRISARLKDLLAGHPLLCGPTRSGSSGAGGDLIEQAVGSLFEQALGELCAGGYVGTTGQRSRDDLRFVDSSGVRHHVNVKGQDLGRKFHMPNLIAADSLRRFLLEGVNTPQQYSLLIVRYRLTPTRVAVEEVLFLPLEWVSWNSLAIRTQGKGVIQLSRGLRIEVNPDQCPVGWRKDFYQRYREYNALQIRRAEEMLRRLNAESVLWDRAMSRQAPLAVAGATAGQMGLFGDEAELW